MLKFIAIPVITSNYNGRHIPTELISGCARIYDSAEEARQKAIDIIKHFYTNVKFSTIVTNQFTTESTEGIVIIKEIYV